MNGGSAALPECAVVEDVAWFRVDQPSTVGAARRAAASLADRLGMSEKRIGEVSIVAAELTSNLCKHADEGTLILRSLRCRGTAGLELAAVDAGPGMPDLNAAVRDGHSTAGTLGIGLGAITRLSTSWDAYSVPQRGTVLVARLWASGADWPSWAEGVTRPITGEQVCGDGWAVRSIGTCGQVLVSDGLGHGPHAARATRVALEAFQAAPTNGPAAAVEHLHRALTGTRGAALAVAEIDPDAGLVRFAGLGNIAGAVVDLVEHRRMVSMPGIAGHQRRVVRQFEYPLDRESAVVLHSDGVHDRWSVSGLPGLMTRSPVVTAATVLRDAGVRRDDACVLVARVPR